MRDLPDDGHKLACEGIAIDSFKYYCEPCNQREKWWNVVEHIANSQSKHKKGLATQATIAANGG